MKAVRGWVIPFQPDLFDREKSAPALSPALRQEQAYGERDAESGLPLCNWYSDKLWGERLAAYETGYRRAIAQLRARA